MSNIGARLRKLEPPPEHQEYLKEVCLRLMRYSIERRHEVYKDGPPTRYYGGDAGCPDFEKYYKGLKDHPLFNEICREVHAANPEYSEMGRECSSCNKSEER